MSDEQVHALDGGADFELSEPVTRATDPNISNVGTPGDFTAQYPQPLDTTEILSMCEEISVLMAIPEENTNLIGVTWREMSSLAFTSGSYNYLSFEDGTCPEEYEHDGANTTINTKNIGVKKSLKLSEIKHSMAVSAANWNGINNLVAGPSNQNPGEFGSATFAQQHIADLKAKEIRLGATLAMNGWDNRLVLGNTGTSTNQFDGIEQYETQQSVTFYSNTGNTTGTFSASQYDLWLSESCAKPTHIFGHPTAIAQLLSSYFQLGFQGSQVINVSSGERITPGFNFSSFINTGVGRVQVVADENFTRTTAGFGTFFQAHLWSFRMTHNGVPLVYRLNQFPLSVQDLAPGCTAVSFQIWAKTALIIKHACAHGNYTAKFSLGGISGGCSLVG